MKGVEDGSTEELLFLAVGRRREMFPSILFDFLLQPLALVVVLLCDLRHTFIFDAKAFDLRRLSRFFFSEATKACFDVAVRSGNRPVGLGHET